MEGNRGAIPEISGHPPAYVKDKEDPKQRSPAEFATYPRLFRACEGVGDKATDCHSEPCCSLDITPTRNKRL